MGVNGSMKLQEKLIESVKSICFVSYCLRAIGIVSTVKKSHSSSIAQAKDTMLSLKMG